MTDSGCGRRACACVLAGVALLCAAAYLRALSLPLISDDYVHIALAREQGPLSGWTKLASDPLYRCRTTSQVPTYWLERLFGLEPLAYNSASLLLHIFNTWLVFALGAWRLIGWRVSALAAAFFAVYEGHQGAVMWYAAIPEELVFFFGLASLVFWILWLQAGSGRTRYYAASFASFLLALGSKESGVVVVPLLVVAWWLEGGRRRARLLLILPYGLVALAYAASIYGAKSTHLFFSDGTFSLEAPFWITLANSTGRLFWFWGILALLALAAWGTRKWRPLLILAGLWIPITLLPYSFLTYMPRVPSRHTYLASAGLALIVAAGFVVFRERMGKSHRWAVALVAILVVVHNCGYLWTKKQAQYLERAAPTEALVEFVRQREGPVYVHCFPYDFSAAHYAVELRLNEEVLPMPPEVEDPSAVFCWKGDYRPLASRRSPAPTVQRGD